jgi:hypothetical protein
LTTAVLLGLGTICSAASSQEEPTIYVVKQGDTLWGLSEQFLRDPYTWPNLWARNKEGVTNPHLIFPGQKLRIFADRIEIVDDREAGVEAKPGTQPAKERELQKFTQEAAAAERLFTVTGGEGFLQENGFKPVGYIISTFQNREIVGEDDIVYTDIGKIRGAKVGNRYSIFRKLAAVSHPVTNQILGERVIPLGILQLTQVEDDVSKAIITRSFQEIGAGAYIVPYKDKRRDVALKAASRDLTGFIVESRTGNKALSAGDVVYLDLGKQHGLAEGNLLYVTRDIQPDPKYVTGPISKLPSDVVGALVVVELGERTATALIVKSIDTVYVGDRVELTKNSK